MSTFADTLSGWHDFYVLAGGAAATLTGLLFVAVSIHIDVLAHEKGGTLRGVAGQILFNFIYVIVISLTAVSSAVSKELLFIVLLAAGGTGLARLILRAVGVSRQERDWFKEEVQKPINGFAHIVLPATCFVTLIVSGVGLLVATEQAQIIFLVLMIAVIYLIVRSIVDTWSMLILVAIVKQNHSQTTA